MPDPKPPRESLSKVPSWIMLGAVIGAILTVTVQRRWAGEPPPPEEPKAVQTAVEQPPELKPADVHMSLLKMEEIFALHSDRALFRHGFTEVAFWNELTNEYTIFVEILKSGDDFYFRNIPALTRPLNDRVNDAKIPVRFTETEESRAERRGGFFLPGK